MLGATVSATTDPVQAQVRGIMISATLEYVETRWGEDVRGAVLEACRPAIAGAIRSVVDGGWYPVAWQNGLDAAVVEATGNPDALYELGHDTAGPTIRAELGRQPHMVPLERLFERSPQLMRAYFEGAGCEELERERGRALRRYEGPGFAQTLWDRFRGSLVGMLEAVGCHEVDAVIREGGGESGFMLVELRWRGR